MKLNAPKMTPWVLAGMFPQPCNSRTDHESLSREAVAGEQPGPCGPPAAAGFREKAIDKKKAIRKILNLQDANDFLQLCSQTKFILAFLCCLSGVLDIVSGLF
jgi:hypothetical protein